MTIGIDIDDTICSTNEKIIVEADKYDKEVLGGSGVKDINAYEFTEMMGWEKDMKGKFFKDKLEYIMDNAEVKDGAKEIINKLYDEGNKIIFISFRKGKYINEPYILTKKYLDRNGIKYNKIYVDTGSKVDECINEKVDLFTLISRYGQLVYSIDGKTKTQNVAFKQKEPHNVKENNTYYMEVLEEIQYADHISFIFKIRGAKYIYSLK